MTLGPVSSKWFPVVVLPLILASVALPGCDSTSYSDAIRYLVRTDPLVLDKPTTERPEPDRPGQLPLLSAKDLRDFPNPFYQDAADQKKDDLIKNNKLRDPNQLSAKDRKQLQKALNDRFGRPNRPKVVLDDEATVVKLDLTPDKLLKGSNLYRLHCLVCHGVTGNGRGPNARWVNPHPRDYRQGLFKFQSVDQAVDDKTRKPSRGDLLRTLQQGIEGTSMPSFGLLPEADLENLVSYVMHLSIRGEAEFATLKNAYTYDSKTNALVANDDPPPVSYLDGMIQKLGQDWLQAQSKAIPVAPYPSYSKQQMAASIRRGQALFLADDALLREHFPKTKTDANELNKLKSASCVKCHVDYGRKADFKFDDWGTLVRPANLITGKYRGGRRPVDIYYRVHSGINGSGMAPFGATLPADQLWDVVNFVRLLPYPQMLRTEYSVDIH